MTDSYEYKYSRSKRRDRGHYLSREAEIFLESSNRTKNKMLGFMEVDEDYKRFGAKPEKEFNSAINEGIGNPKAK
jgi:hypothetical protein